ncbi:MAG: ribosome maturation factor RimM [Cytophagaceae bacterium]|jgi:16S rRNA processing protein RimM|nr:ribosome maturation factor RimM [Cytophagaceae bacterium]
MRSKSLVELGKIVKAHGLKGDLSVQLLFEAEQTIEELESVYLDMNGKQIPFFIEFFNPTPNKRAILRLEDCQSLQETAKYIGKTIFIPEEELLEDDLDVSLHQLIGFTLVDKTLGTVGTVLELMEMPGQYMLKLKAGNLEPLVPFNDTFILRIDKEGKRIEADLPEGLLDL